MTGSIVIWAFLVGLVIFSIYLLNAPDATKTPPETPAQVVTRLLATTGRRQVDMTRRTWGHSMEKCGGIAKEDGSWAVWSSPRLRVGDSVRTERGEFVAYEVRACGDPPDMVFAKFLNVDRASEVTQ